MQCQWRSQPKMFGGAKMFDFGQATGFLFEILLLQAQNA